MLMGYVKPKFYKDEKKLFKEIKKELSKTERWFYFSETEEHNLIFFITGHISLEDLYNFRKELIKLFKGIHKKYEFTFGLEWYDRSRINFDVSFRELE